MNMVTKKAQTTATAADFGRREDAAEDAADDDDDGGEAGERLPGDAERVAQRHELALGVAAPGRDDEGEHHQRQADHDAGDDAGHEQLRDRDGAAGGVGIDDRVVARRDDDALGRAADGQVDGEMVVVALLLHHRDHDRADRRGIGDGRAGDAAEEHRGEDIDHRQAAAHEADEDVGEGDQPARHAALGHQRAGEDEEGDGEQGEIVDAVGDLEEDRLKRQADVEGAGQRRHAERIGDRHAEHEEDEEAAEQNDRCERAAHFLSLSRKPSLRASSSA